MENLDWRPVHIQPSESVSGAECRARRLMSLTSMRGSEGSPRPRRSPQVTHSTRSFEAASAPPGPFAKVVTMRVRFWFGDDDGHDGDPPPVISYGGPDAYDPNAPTDPEASRRKMERVFEEMGPLPHDLAPRPLTAQERRDPRCEPAPSTQPASPRRAQRSRKRSSAAPSGGWLVALATAAVMASEVGRALKPRTPRQRARPVPTVPAQSRQAQPSVQPSGQVPHSRAVGAPNAVAKSEQRRQALLFAHDHAAGSTERATRSLRRMPAVQSERHRRRRGAD
jgi:hypothetical protein